MSQPILEGQILTGPLFNEQQHALTLQSVERITSILVLPHPERSQPEVRRLQPVPEVENIAMRLVMEHETARGCQVYDIHEKNLGHDITSLDLNSGELRLIEVKGIGAATGTVLLTPNERRACLSPCDGRQVAEDRPVCVRSRAGRPVCPSTGRRDCYWLYVVTGCKSAPSLQEPIKNPARFPWHEVKKVDHYYLSVDALTQPMRVREPEEPYGNPPR